MAEKSKTSFANTKEQAPGNGKPGSSESRNGGSNEKENKAKKEAFEKNKKEVAERRDRIRRSVRGALTHISKELKSKHLSPEVRARYEWARDAALNAKKQSLDISKDVYKVEAMEGKTKISREEGVPVEELLRIMFENEEKLNVSLQEIKRLKKSKQEVKTTQERYTINKPEDSNNEYEVKTAWHKAYQQLEKDSPLKQQAEELVAKWEAADREAAKREGGEFSGYNEEQRRLQLGQAVKELASTPKNLVEKEEQRLKALGDSNERAQKYLRHLQKVLYNESTTYFELHNKKKFKDLTPAEKENQKAYTDREAKLISHDPRYRTLLLKRYQAVKMLPANFEKLHTDQQNEQLAVLALQHRRVLNMPKVTVEEPKPIGGQEKIGTKSTTQVVEDNIVSGPDIINDTTPPIEDEVQDKKQPEWKLQNTNEPYDIENLANTEWKLKNTNEPYDLENLAHSIEKQKSVDPNETKIININEKKTIYLVDVSEIAKRMAWTKAEEQLRQKFDVHGEGFFKKFGKNAWKGVSEDYYRVKFYKDALAEIESDNNLMRAIEEHASGAPSKARKEGSGEYYKILESTINQYKAEVVDTQREVGEKIEGNDEVKAQVADLIYRHATGKWADLGGKFTTLNGRDALEQFVKEKIVPQFKNASWTKETDRTGEAKGKLFSSNFYEIAEQYKQFIEQERNKVVAEHGPEVEKAIKEHVAGMLKLDVQLGLKERDLMNNKPKPVLVRYEQLANKFENNPVLGKILTNPLVVGGLTSIGGSWGIRKLAKAGLVSAAVAAGATGFWVPIAAGAFIGAGMKFAKRSKDIKYDTNQELRYETLGGKGSKVLEGKEWFNNVGDLRYDTMSFKDALTAMETMKDKTTLNTADKQELAKILSRLYMERELNADSSKKPGQRYSIDLFTLEEDEGKKYGTTEVAKGDLRIAIKNLEKVTDFTKDVELQNLLAQERQSLLDMISDIDKKQDKFRKVEAVKSALTGAVMGVAGGVASHWITGHFSEASAHMKAAVGGSVGHAREVLKGSGSHDSIIRKAIMSVEDWHKKLGVVKLHHHDWHHDHNLESAANLSSGHHIYSGKELQGLLSHDSKTDNVTFNYHGAVENIAKNIRGETGMLGENWDHTIDSRFHDLMPENLQHQMQEVFDLKAEIENNYPNVDFEHLDLATAPEALKNSLHDLANLDHSYMQAANKFIDKLHEHMQVRIIPTEAMNKAHEGIIAGQLDRTGKLVFNGDLRNLAFDKDGHQIAKYLEVGYEDGHGKWHNLATSVASGEGHMTPVPEENITQHVAKNLNVVKPTAPEITKGQGYGVATVLPERKIYERPEDRERAEKARQQKQAEAERARLAKDQKVREAEERKNREEEARRRELEPLNREKELRENNKDAFDKEKVRANVGIYQRYLTKQQKADVGVDTKLIKTYWDAEAKLVGEKILHEQGPSTQEYLVEIEKLNKAAEKVEQNFERVQELDKRIRAILVDKKPIDLDDDAHELRDEFKKLRGKPWTKSFKAEEYRKEVEDLLEAEIAPQAAAADHDDEPDEPEQEKKDDGKDKSAKEKENLEQAINAFKAKHKNIDLEISNSWPVSFKKKQESVKNLEKVCDELAQDKELKIGKIKVILKAKGKPVIGEKVWELPADITSDSISKILKKKLKQPKAA